MQALFIFSLFDFSFPIYLPSLNSAKTSPHCTYCSSLPVEHQQQLHRKVTATNYSQDEPITPVILIDWHDCSRTGALKGWSGRGATTGKMEAIRRHTA